MILFGFLLSLSTTCFATVVPSSAIPDRREFPVNESVSPCEDFYKYTCSKVEESFKLRDDRSRHTFSFSDSAERILEKKKTYLAALPKQEKKNKSEQELSDFYSSCLNTTQRAFDEKAYVKKELATVQGLKTRTAFLKFLGERVGTEQPTFFEFSPFANQKDPQIKDLFIGTDLRGLPAREYYKDKKVIRSYTQLLVDFFKTIGLKKPHERARRLVAFEKKFDQTYPTPAEWRKLYTNPDTIKREDLLLKYPMFYLGSFLEKIPKKTLIRNVNPKNFETVHTAFKEEPLELLKDLYLYQALSSAMDEGYPKYHSKKFAFNKKHLGGAKVREELKERCTRVVMSKFGNELDYEIFDQVLPNFKKSKFVKLAEKVRKSLLKSIKNNTWLSKEGKKNAYKKIKKAPMQLVKPDRKKYWDFNYKADYSPTAYLANQKLWSKKQNEKTYDDFVKKRSKKIWWMSPLTVNAYYSPTQNKFVMLGGILQYPFYDQSLPEHINLAAAGMVVGHELGHGVDDSGSKFDYKGRVQTWMSPKDIENFKKRGGALETQFDGIGHNGKLTLGENIGDLVGLTAAYQAAFSKGEGTQTQKKEFFTQYGRLWCTVIRPGVVKRYLRTNPHSLGYARVNEQVKHQPGFYEAFGCKAKDKMFLSADKRVTIW